MRYELSTGIKNIINIIIKNAIKNTETHEGDKKS